MSLPPDIAVTHSALWVQATSADDPDAWGAATAAARWQTAGGQHTPAQVRLLAAQLSALAEVAFATGCFGAFVLVPDPARGPVGVARLNAVQCEPGGDPDQLARDLLLPDELQLLPPEVTVLEAPCGPARRIRQRAFSEHTRAVSDYLTFAYAFADAAWVLTMSFPQPSDTEDWLPELDLLAQGVDLVRGAA